MSTGLDADRRWATEALRYFAALPAVQLRTASEALAQFSIPDFHPRVALHDPLADYLAGIGSVFIHYYRVFYDLVEIGDDHPLLDFRHRLDDLWHIEFDLAWSAGAVRDGSNWRRLRSEAARALRRVAAVDEGSPVPLDIASLVDVDEYTTSRETHALMKQLGLI